MLQALEANPKSDSQAWHLTIWYGLSLSQPWQKEAAELYHMLTKYWKLFTHPSIFIKTAIDKGTQ